jgi:hypothetical protein
MGARMKQGSAFQQLRMALIDMQADALNEIGESGVDVLVSKLNDNYSVASGRLEQSMSYATNVNSSGSGSDAVTKPTSKEAVRIGTRCPYAVYVDKGMSVQQVQSESPVMTEKKILDWADDKIGGGDNSDFAARVYNKIQMSGTDAHPFWNESVQNDKERC